MHESSTRFHTSWWGCILDCLVPEVPRFPTPEQFHPLESERSPAFGGGVDCSFLGFT